MKINLPSYCIVGSCPACGYAGEHLAKLPGGHYELGRAAVDFPPGGISLLRCGQCGLFYKGQVPDSSFLTKILATEAPYYWLSEEGFGAVATQLQDLVGAHYDLLDVGASSGGLLASVGSLAGRRSALDISYHSGLEGLLRGEFINGFIDAPNLDWSGAPYDVITLFDVLEHLYQPQQAFSNLSSLLKPGGYLVIETGNAQCAAQLASGPASWWYLRLLEHHVAWTPQALKRIAEYNGFSVESLNPVAHKASTSLSLGRAWRLLKAGLRSGGYRVWLSKVRLERLKRVNRANGDGQPDHLRVVMRKQADN